MTLPTLTSPKISLADTYAVVYRYKTIRSNKMEVKLKQGGNMRLGLTGLWSLPDAVRPPPQMLQL